MKIALRKFLCEEKCFADRENKACFLSNSRDQIITEEDIEELFPKVDVFYFIYQHVDCRYTLLKDRFSGKSFVKKGEIFDNVKRAFHYNEQNSWLERMPRMEKKKLLRKNYTKRLLKSF